MHIVGIVAFILVIIAVSQGISCHNCVNDDSKSKEDCQGDNDIGYYLNVFVLVVACIMVLVHIAFLVVPDLAEQYVPKGLQTRGAALSSAITGQSAPGFGRRYRY